MTRPHERFLHSQPTYGLPCTICCGALTSTWRNGADATGLCDGVPQLFVGRLIAIGASPLRTKGEPTAATMPLPAPTQRTRSEHHVPALPVGRSQCCDLSSSAQPSRQGVRLCQRR